MRALIAFSIIAAAILAAGAGGARKDDQGKNPRFEKTWPDASDLAWFQQAKGKSEKEVLAIYGLPVEKRKLENGRTRWRYPWAANAQIEFKSGIATSVFYTAGY